MVHLEAHSQKRLAALGSVGAAVGLTTIKVVVAILTGSLGILAEAAHSALDLVAALMTYFAVRVADRPADSSHHYGHGKIENLSAFLEVILLIVTALWIIYEAIQRLFNHTTEIDLSVWAFVVMLISIVVDVTRSRALMKVAKEHGSQALEADALHFTTDIWSSCVVLFGLMVIAVTRWLHLPSWLQQADAIAALGVSGIVIWASVRLARETIDALTDRVPEHLADGFRKHIQSEEHVSEIRRVRVRQTGNKFFVDVVIGAPRTLSFEQTHELSERIEQAALNYVHSIQPNGDVDAVVHVEPVASPQETLLDRIYYLAHQHGVHVHDVHIRDVGGMLECDFDLEVAANLSLTEAHRIASQFENELYADLPHLKRVTTHLEAPEQQIVERHEITDSYPQLVIHITEIADTIAGSGSTHDVHLYCSGNHLTQEKTHLPEHIDLVLHSAFRGEEPLSEVHTRAEAMKRALRSRMKELHNITIHTEPEEEVSVSRPPLA